MKRYCYFVYLVPDGDQLCIELPAGGITQRAYHPIEAFDRAYPRACDIYPRKPWEILVLVQVDDRARRYQARIMELDKRRADNAFKIAMLS